jgi:hypothetical protein
MSTVERRKRAREERAACTKASVVSPTPGSMALWPRRGLFWGGSTTRRLQGLAGGLGHLQAAPSRQLRHLGAGGVLGEAGQQGNLHVEPSQAPLAKRLKS